MPEMVVANLANPYPVAYPQHEVLWARCRDVGSRTPVPVAGQLVWYRHRHGGPCVMAVVESVDMENKGDGGVWAFRVDGNNNPVDAQGRPVLMGMPGERMMELVPDPWPDTYLDVPGIGKIVTKEARLPGSRGWLPPRAGGK